MVVIKFCVNVEFVFIFHAQIKTAEWDYRNQNRSSMTPSQTKRQVNTPSRQHDSHTEPTRSQVSIFFLQRFIHFYLENMINTLKMFYRSQQPRWRFIRRRLPQQQRNTWTRVTLHLQQPHGIHASKPPTTICEKPIRLMDVPKVSIVNSPITSFSNPNQFNFQFKFILIMIF